MRYWVIVLLFFICLPLTPETIKAKTENGKDVLLNSDGTWKYSDQIDSTKKMSLPSKSTNKLISRTGDVFLYYDPTKWISQKLDDGSADYQIQSKAGEIYARLITERMSLTMDYVRTFIEQNASKKTESFEVFEEGEKIINGTSIKYLKAKVKLYSNNLIFYWYYWTGEKGTVQLYSYSNNKLFDEKYDDIQNLMDGLVI